MPRWIRAFSALLSLLIVSSVSAERNLARPPGTTRYAAMLQQLTGLLAYDKAHTGRMTLTSLGKSVQGRDLWMVTLHDTGVQAPVPEEPDVGEAGEVQKPAALPSSSPRFGGSTGEAGEGGSPAPKKIFYLCRQHGHEPASTEGALAFINALVKTDTDTPLAKMLTQTTLYIVPMANPDGAEAFLRHNAHDVDLNRDWLRRTQPETRALYAAISRLRPDLMTDQHELYPSDPRPDFTETAGPGSGAKPELITACEDTQTVVQGALLAEGFPTVMHLITDTHPARLAHRYGCIVEGVPTILFETNRLTGSGRTVASRASAQEQFMLTILRDQAGERDQLLAEAAAWQAAHLRNAALLASRHKSVKRTQSPTALSKDKGTE